MNEDISELREKLIVLQNRYDKEYVKDLVGVGRKRIEKNKVLSKKEIENIVSTELKRLRIKQELAIRIAKKSDKIAQLYMLKHLKNDCDPKSFKVSYDLTAPQKIEKKKTRKCYGIVFVNCMFTELLGTEENNNNLKFIELTNLSAYGTTFSETGAYLTRSNHWKEKALKFSSVITPNWLNRLKENHKLGEAPLFSKNLPNIKRLMGLNNFANKIRYLNDQDDFQDNEMMACDEKTTIERFGSYLEDLYHKLNCRKLILASFSSLFSDIENPDSVPISNLISKMIQYGNYEKLEKYVIGFSDLLSNNARKEFTSIFNYQNRKNQYFHEIKPFANDVIKELESALTFSWPSEKNGSQALAGIMTLLAYHSSRKVRRIISLSTDDIRRISNLTRYNMLDFMNNVQACKLNVKLKAINFPSSEISRVFILIKEHDAIFLDIDNRFKKRKSIKTTILSKSMRKRVQLRK